MDLAESEMNREEVERIKASLQELEDSRQTKGKNLKAVRLAEMNKKNRSENFKNTYEKKQVNTSFTTGGGNEAAEVAGTTNVAVFPPTTVAGALKLVDTTAPVDQ
ncbi:hypothetical protein IFM89_011211, partial [Coptis chinensis]